MAVCDNPFYVVFDPNCSYSSQRHKYTPVDKPQVCTRLPLIWPQNSWEENLPEGDPFDNDNKSNITTQDDDKQKDGSDCLWPHNSSGFFDSSTAEKKESNTDLVFPHNTSECRIKQETSYSTSFSVTNTSPVSKDSGNCSYTASSRLDNESFATNEESSGVGGEGVFDFSIEESLPLALISHRRTPAEDGTYNKRSSLLAEQLQEYNLAKEGGYLGLQDYVNFAEVDLSTCYDLETYDKSNSDVSCKQFNGFGRSLMASVSDKYLSDFVLHGTTQKDFTDNLYEDLKAVVRCSVVDDPVDYAQAIVADTNDWSVKIYSVSRPHDVWVPEYNEQCRPTAFSSSIRSMLEATQILWKMNMPAEFCMLHLEDRLQALNETGMMLSSCLAEHTEGNLPSNLPQLSKMFRVDISDMQLLLAVASAHSPEIGKMLHAAQSTNRR